MDTILRLSELALKGALIVSLFFIIPYIVGCLPVMRWRWQTPGVASAIVFGTVLLWAIFLLIAIPCTLWWGKFHGLVALVAAAWGLCVAVSLMLLKKELLAPLCALAKRMRRPAPLPIIVLACMITITAVPVFLEHQDADDATYVVLVTDAVQTDTLYGHDHYTGASLDEDGTRRPWLIGWQRILAPFPLLVAWYAKMSALHPAIMSHTVLPGVLIPLAFMVYYLLARTLFPDPEDHWIFLLIMCTALVFGGFSAWSTGSFLLLRIWQGKALLPAIFLPLSFLLLIQEQRQGLTAALWCALAMVTMAAAVTTTMASVFLPFLLAAFCLFKGWQKRQYGQALILALAGMPAMVQGAAYHLLK